MKNGLNDYGSHLVGHGSKSKETRMNDDRVRLTYARRAILAATLDALVYALTENWELRTGDFDDIIGELRHYRGNPCMCGKPSSVVTGGSAFCSEHSPEFGD
jgi:hypothetical protein